MSEELYIEIFYEDSSSEGGISKKANDREHREPEGEACEGIHRTAVESNLSKKNSKMTNDVTCQQIIFKNEMNQVFILRRRPAALNSNKGLY